MQAPAARGHGRPDLRAMLMLGLVLAVVASACGTRLTEEELAATAGQAGTTGGTGAAVDRAGGDGASAGGDGGTGGVALDADGAPGDGGAAGDGAAPEVGDPAATPTDGDSGGSGDGGDGASAGGDGAADGGSSNAGGGGGSQSQGDGAASSGSESAPASGEPITLGHVGTYSGIVGGLLQGGEAMAQAWAQDVNARGGLNGHPVEMVTADDGGDPSQAQSIVRDMVENQGVQAFVGNLTVFSTEAYTDYLEEQQVPVIGGTLYQLVWWESPILFPHGTYLPDLIVSIARFAADEGNTNLGVIYCAEAFACQQTQASMSGDGASEAGVDIVYESEVSIAQPNFTSECLSAQNAGAEALLVAADDSAISRIARDCESQGFTPQYLTASLAATERAAEDPNLDGLSVGAPVFPWPATDVPGAQAHAEALERYAPDTLVGGSTAQVWAAGKLLEAAAEDLSAPTSEAILDGLYALPDGFTTNGLTPPLTFIEGEPAPKTDCYSKVQVADGEWTAPWGSDFECP